MGGRPGSGENGVNPLSRAFFGDRNRLNSQPVQAAFPLFFIPNPDFLPHYKRGTTKWG